MQIYNFIIAHQAIFAALGIAIIDAAYGFNSNLKSNGLIHFLYVFFGGKAGVSPDAGK